MDLERHLRAAQDAGRQDLDGERAVAEKRHRDEEMLRPLLHGREHDDRNDEKMVAQAGMPRSDALQGGQQADADESDEKDAPIVGRPMLAGAADLVVAGHDDDEAGDAQRHVDEEHPVPAQRADDDAGEHRSDKRGDAPSEVVLKAMTFGRRFSGVTPAMIVKVTVMMAPPLVPSGRGRR